jgi:hypothetical protein
VGAHIFYRNPGFNGTAAAFNAPYAGRELISGPARTSWPAKPIVPVEAQAMPIPLPNGALAPTAAPSWSSPGRPGDTSADSRLPQSTIKPEYRNSGRPLI